MTSPSFTPREEAMKALTEGRKMQLTIEQAAYTYGGALYQEGDLFGAKHFFLASIALDPHNALAHLMLSGVYAGYGDRRMAVHHASHAVSLGLTDVMVPAAFHRLAKAAPQRVPVESLQLFASSRDPMVRGAGQRSLAWVLEYQQDYAAAWRHHTEANRARLQLCGEWDDAGLEHAQAVAQHAPWETAIQEARTERRDGPLRVFIVGMPRTGTTLLERYFLRCPGVYSLGEETSLAQIFAQVESRGPKNLVRIGLENDAWALRCAQRDQARGVFPSEPVEVIVSKLPGNLECAGLIPLLWGQRGVVIRCQRDPRAVAISCFTQDFAQDQHNWSCSLTSIRRVAEAYAEFAKVYRPLFPAGNWIDFQSSGDAEDLMALVEQVTGKFPSGKDHDLPAATASSYQVQQAPSPKIASKWKDYLPYYEAALAEEAEP